MSRPSGDQVKAAFRKAAAWGTALACGAGHGILLMPHNLKKEKPPLPYDSLGVHFAKGQDQDNIVVAGDLPAYLRYDSLDLLIAMPMGATGGAPSQQGATAAYAQTLTLTDDTEGLFGTLAVNDLIGVHEFPSVKVIGFTIRGQTGKPLEILFHCIATDRITDSSVNDLTSFANVTFFETANRVLFSEGVWRMNDQDGDALDDNDKVYPNSFELVFKRAQSGEYVGGSIYVDEPSNDDQPEITLNLGFPRYDAAAKAYFEAWAANTAKKLDITFTGAVIEGAYSREFKLQFPNLMFSGTDLPYEKGKLKAPVDFRCYGCATAPTGMSGITLPFQVDVINRQSADVLA